MKEHTFAIVKLESFQELRSKISALSYVVPVRFEVVFVAINYMDMINA
jgi:hypothetical protein